MKNAKALVMALALLAPVSAPAGASLFHHQPAVTTQQAQPAPQKKGFIRRHPVISAIGAAVVIHHFTHKK